MAVVLGVVALVLAAAGVVAVVADDGDDDHPVVQSVTDQASTTTLLPETTTTTTTLPVTTTTVARATTTTVRRTTTTRGPTTTTTRPGATTTTTHPLCAAEQIDIRVDIATSFPPGAPVGMTTTIRNKSSAACYYRGYTVTMTFLNPAGQTIVAQGVHADDIEDRVFAPNQSITHDATWDPVVCPTPPCTEPPGFYSVSAEWSFSGGRYGATQQFIVRTTA